MKRIVVRVLVLLVIGAVVNVVVAWGIGLTVSTSSTQAPMRDALKWPQDPPSDWPAPDDARENAHFGNLDITASHNLHELLRTRMGDPTVIVHWMVDYRFGWPMRSLCSTALSIQSGRAITPIPGNLIQSGVIAPPLVNPSRFGTRRIALNPIATGFAVNTLCYGVLAAAVAVAFSQARSRARLRRGLCACCSYPIGTSPVCTECGKPIPARTLRSRVGD